MNGEGPFTVDVDNGAAVHLGDVPDRMAHSDPSPRAGKWGGPPRLNRWFLYQDHSPYTIELYEA